MRLRPLLKHTYDTLWHHSCTHLKPPAPIPGRRLHFLWPRRVLWNVITCVRHSQRLKHLITLATRSMFCYLSEDITHVIWMLMCVNVLSLIEKNRFTWHHVTVVSQTHGPSHEQETTPTTTLRTQRCHLMMYPFSPVRTIPLSSLTLLFNELFNWWHESLFLCLLCCCCCCFRLMTGLLLCSRSFFLSSGDLLVFSNSPASPSSVCLRPHLKHTCHHACYLDVNVC